MQVLWWGYHNIVGTLKPYLIQKEFVETFCTHRQWDANTSGMSAHAITRAQATYETFTNYFYLGINQKEQPWISRNNSLNKWIQLREMYVPVESNHHADPMAKIVRSDQLYQKRK